MRGTLRDENIGRDRRGRGIYSVLQRRENAATVLACLSIVVRGASQLLGYRNLTFHLFIARKTIHQVDNMALGAIDTSNGTTAPAASGDVVTKGVAKIHQQQLEGQGAYDIVLKSFRLLVADLRQQFNGRRPG